MLIKEQAKIKLFEFKYKKINKLNPIVLQSMKDQHR